MSYGFVFSNWPNWNMNMNRLNSTNRYRLREIASCCEWRIVGIDVQSLDNTIVFFTETGLKLEGRTAVEGEWTGRVTGPENQCVEMAIDGYA